MIMNKNNITGRPTSYSRKIEKVDKNTYLGSFFNSQSDHSCKMKYRMEQVRAAYTKSGSV